MKENITKLIDNNNNGDIITISDLQKEFLLSYNELAFGKKKIIHIAVANQLIMKPNTILKYCNNFLLIPEDKRDKMIKLLIANLDAVLAQHELNRKKLESYANKYFKYT